MKVMSIADNLHVEICMIAIIPHVTLERWRTWAQPLEQTDYCEGFLTIYRVSLFGWGLAFSVPGRLANGLRRLLFGTCPRCGGANYG